MRKQINICVGENSHRVLNVETDLTDEELIKSVDILDFISNKRGGVKLISINDFDDKMRHTQIWPYKMDPHLLEKMQNVNRLKPFP